MELYEEMLYRNFGAGGGALWYEPAFRQRIAGFLESQCYRVLRRIREITADEALDDAACFARVEEIVCALETLGVSAGGRHDF